MDIKSKQIIGLLGVVIVILLSTLVFNLFKNNQSQAIEVVAQYVHDSPPVNNDAYYNPILIFTCDNAKEFTATYSQADHSPGPGAIFIPERITSLVLSLSPSGDKIYLSNDTFSREGGFSLYKDNSLKTIFRIYELGQKASVTQNGVVTYNNCREAIQ